MRDSKSPTSGNMNIDVEKNKSEESAIENKLNSGSCHNDTPSSHAFDNK